MEASNISAEMQQEIQDKANGFRAAMFGHPHATELTMAYVDGIGEFASKLYLLQQEYDKLIESNRRTIEVLLLYREDRKKDAIEYDKLKGDYERDFYQAELNYEVLLAEHHALKSMAARMSVALELAEVELKSLYRKLGYLSSNVLTEVTDCLSSYNSNTNNQNENDG